FDAAKTLERGIGGAAVARMSVAALAVGLPGLEQDAIERLAGAVGQPALDANTLARGVRRHRVAGDELFPVVVRPALFIGREARCSERTDGLRRSNAGHFWNSLKLRMS